MPRPRTIKRSCRHCGWANTYDTPARADYGKRRHSCEKNLALAARRTRAEATEAAIDRTPKPCHHKAGHQHGTNAAYILDRCRCLPCAAAHSAQEMWRERQKAYGRYDKYVDAEPVRQHIRSLMAQGMGLKRICVVGGANTGQLWKLLYGKKKPDGTRAPTKRVLREVADRLLAIEVDLADGARIDATGSIRRVRALVALGWTQNQIASRLDVTRSNFQLGTGRATHVTVKVARQVTALYDELSMTVPTGDNHQQRGAITRAREHAKRHGWLPPLALDDNRLDDPTYKPATVAAQPPDDGGIDEAAIYRRMDGDRSIRLTKPEQAELRRRWLDSGRSLNEMQRITGINPHRHKEAS